MASSKSAATAAIRALHVAGVAFTKHPYDYVAQGGAQHAAAALGVPLKAVVKTLVMQDEKGEPLLVLMHGDRQVGLKQLARQIGARSVRPCQPDQANRHTGYVVGGISPFGTRRALRVYVEASILELDRIYINAGRRGLLVEIAPDVLGALLDTTAVRVGSTD